MTKQAEKKYRIRNWGEYNRALVQRGSITLWFSEESINKWHSAPKGVRGRPQIYSDEAILCALLIKTVYHLPLRALQGFICSMIYLLKLSITAPSYTQICRRTSASSFSTSGVVTANLRRGRFMCTQQAA